MKKKIFMLTSFIAFTTAIVCCKTTTTNQPTTDHTTTDASTKDTLSFCVDYSDAVISTLPIEVIRKMTETYRVNQLEHIESKLGVKDAQAIWFDLVTLKKFIYHIEKQSKSIDNSITDKELGIRIYYASYTKDPIYNKNKVGLTTSRSSAYAEKHTLLMIPTLKEQSIDYDFNPLDAATYSFRAQSIPAKNITFPQFFDDDAFVERIELKENFMVLGTLIKADTSYVARNHGGLFPPGDASGQHFLNTK